MIHKKFLVMGLVLVLGWAHQGFAQDMSGDALSGTVEKVKADANYLFKENEKLNSEYEFLQDKANGLKAQIEKMRNQIKAQQQQNRDLKKFQSEQSGSDTALNDKMVALQNDITALESKNKDLKKQLADTEEKNRLWKMKASGLENQKHDAMLDANYQELEGDQADSQDQAKLEQLREDLKAATEQEAALKMKLANLNKKGTGHSVDKAQLKKQTSELQARVAQLKKQVSQQQKENEKLKKQAQKAGLSNTLNRPDLVKEKKNLEAEVDKLSHQLEAVNKSVEETKLLLARKRKLMDQVMHLDAENQEMRAKIDRLLKPSAPEKTQTE